MTWIISDLKKSIVDFLNRDDLDEVIPYFISLAESKINREVRSWRMIKILNIKVRRDFDIILNNRTYRIGDIEMPDDLRDTFMLESPSNESYKFNANFFSPIEGNSYCYAGKSIYVYPVHNGSFNIHYFSELDSLSENDTNWMLKHYPDVYLYGSLIQAASYLHDPTVIEVYKGMYMDALSEIDDEKWSMNDVSLRMRAK